jgi:hypothetical protein
VIGGASIRRSILRHVTAQSFANSRAKTVPFGFRGASDNRNSQDLAAARLRHPIPPCGVMIWLLRGGLLRQDGLHKNEEPHVLRGQITL